jgi:hypothetical protein
LRQATLHDAPDDGDIDTYANSMRGIVIGAVAAVAAARLMKAMLLGVSAADPATLPR